MDEESPQVNSPRSKRNLPLIITGVAIFAGLVLLCMFAYLLLGPASNQDSADTTITPTPFSSTSANLDTGFVSVNLPDSVEPIRVNVDSPLFLGIGNREFSTQVDLISPDGRWNPSLADEDTASWVFGTVVNYVYGLADTQTNRTLMESLQPGDELRIATKSGGTLTYAFNSREITNRTDQDVFSQATPGITIVLMGTDGDDRMVIRGTYVSADGASDDSGGDGTVDLGEPGSFGDVQITVLGATQIYDAPQAPVGFNFYVVDFQIQNDGTVPFITNQLILVLRDDLGNQYAASPVATQTGTYPALVSAVPPGESVIASVGYAIPSGLDVSSVYWVVIDPVTALELTVKIPFAGASESGEGTQITLIAADVSEDGTSLVLQGQITNQGNDAVIVAVNDVSLESNGTVYLLLSTNPAFPWVVNPGQTLIYFVSFQRPAGSEAVFTVLNQSYQLTGLR